MADNQYTEYKNSTYHYGEDYANGYNDLGVSGYVQYSVGRYTSTPDRYSTLYYGYDYDYHPVEKSDGTGGNTEGGEANGSESCYTYEYTYGYSNYSNSTATYGYVYSGYFEEKKSGK